MIFDNHTHSHFSTDSNMPIGAAIRKAAATNLGGIAITDHFDFDVPAGVQQFTFDINDQQREIDSVCKSLHLKDFVVLKGIEVGVQPHCLKEISETLKCHSFDTVIASLHFVDGKDPYHGDYYTPYDCHQAYKKYLETIYTCLSQYDDFDILGHFDYIARYSPYPQSTIYYKDFPDILDSILKLLADNGKTFEINTKTYQLYRGKEPLLDSAIVKRFAELGGEFISFGSDAHTQERIGENFNRYISFVRENGIKYSVYYKKRKAVTQLL